MHGYANVHVHHVHVHAHTCTEAYTKASRYTNSLPRGAKGLLALGAGVLVRLLLLPPADTPSFTLKMPCRVWRQAKNCMKTTSTCTAKDPIDDMQNSHQSSHVCSCLKHYPSLLDAHLHVYLHIYVFFTQCANDVHQTNKQSTQSYALWGLITFTKQASDQNTATLKRISSRTFSHTKFT